jgi:small subunit ribosomal protein S5
MDGEDVTHYPCPSGVVDFGSDFGRELRLEGLLEAQKKEESHVSGEEAVDAGRRVRGMTSSVLSVNRVQKPTKGGKIMSYKALVVAGNMRGAAGYGVAKGPNVQTAVQKAFLEAQKTMQYVDRHAEKTLYHDVTGQRGSTKVVMRSAPPGKGLRASHIVRSICVAFGIEDCVAKCYGQRNPYSVTQVNYFHIRIFLIRADDIFGTCRPLLMHFRARRVPNKSL